MEWEDTLTKVTPCWMVGKTHFVNKTCTPSNIPQIKKRRGERERKKTHSSSDETNFEIRALSPREPLFLGRGREATNDGPLCWRLETSE